MTDDGLTAPAATEAAGAAATAPVDPGRHLTAPTTRSALRIQHQLLTAAREFLRGRGSPSCCRRSSARSPTRARAAPSRSTSTSTATATS
ncbi:hypothetical protein ACFQ0M_10315 [Kitasatospora aburaviensis]